MHIKGAVEHIHPKTKKKNPQIYTPGLCTQKIEIKLRKNKTPYDPGISLLGTQPEASKSA